jgi:hypothetical protein
MEFVSIPRGFKGVSRNCVLVDVEHNFNKNEVSSLSNHRFTTWQTLPQLDPTHFLHSQHQTPHICIVTIASARMHATVVPVGKHFVVTDGRIGYCQQLAPTSVLLITLPRADGHTGTELRPVQGMPACYRPDPAGFQPTSPELFSRYLQLLSLTNISKNAPKPHCLSHEFSQSWPRDTCNSPRQEDIAGSKLRTPIRIVRPNPLPRQDIAGPYNFNPPHIPRPPNPLPSDAIPVRQVAAACKAGDLDRH